MIEFFGYDSVPEDENRFIIFIHQNKLEKFENKNSFFADGTFRSVPSSFHQYIIIFSTILAKNIPYCYILIMKKDKQTI